MNRLISVTNSLRPARPLLLAGAILLAGTSGVATAATTEAECLAVLQSDAARKDKADACRELARIGTRNAVPVLADLLDDEAFAHMARYALESIPDPSVDVALREALGRVDSRLQIGVIGSIGVRRDGAACDALSRLLNDADPGVAGAAAHALGQLGSAPAATALEGALLPGTPAPRPAVIEGLLRCAESLMGEGEQQRAIAIYDRLRTDDQAPHQVRVAGLRGAVLARGEAGLPLVVEALRSEEFAMVAAAAQAAQELPGASVTRALADALAQLPADTQVVVAAALGLRRDPAAVPGLLALASTGEPAVRIAAIRAVVELGDPAIVPTLLELQSDADPSVAVAAQTALTALEGPEVDDALIDMLGRHPTQGVMDLVTRRRIHRAVPHLLAIARDGDPSLRVTAIRAAGDLAGGEDLPTLIDLLLAAPTPAELRAAENALTSLCVRLSRPDPANVRIERAVYGDLPDGPSRDVTRDVTAMLQNGTFSVQASNRHFGDPAPGIPKRMTLAYTVHGQVRSQTVAENQAVEIRAGTAPPAVSEALCAALSRAGGTVKPGVLRVLRSTGGEQALAAVVDTMDDADPDVRAAAVSVLAGWPTVDAVPELLRLAASTSDSRTRILALRGSYRLIPMQTGPDARKLDQVKQALALSDRPAEKRLALSALAGIARPASLAMVLPYLEDEAIAEEAGLAAVAIAEPLAAASPTLVAQAAERVLDVVGNAETRTRAQALVHP